MVGIKDLDFFLIIYVKIPYSGIRVINPMA